MNYDRIRQALQYIEDHLDQPLTYEQVAEAQHFSPYYFHRLFSAVVGATITAHIRNRRLARAAALIAGTSLSLLDICMTCGFDSPQAFARTFRAAYGQSPSHYRRDRMIPNAPSVDELVIRFTNRLQGGMLVTPNLMKRDRLRIAGVTGDGMETGEIWCRFMQHYEAHGMPGECSAHGYEIRFYPGKGRDCDCHVGHAVNAAPADPAYTLVELPASEYASFEVFVSQGYDSENNAMDEWLAHNPQGYRERLLDGVHYCVEYYDERFRGEEEGSIVEIWVPVEKGE